MDDKILFASLLGRIASVYVHLLRRERGGKALERELNALGYGMTADTISAIKRQARLPLIVAIAVTVVIVALLAYLLNSCNN